MTEKKMIKKLKHDDKLHTNMTNYIFKKTIRTIFLKKQYIVYLRLLQHKVYDTVTSHIAGLPILITVTSFA